MRKKTLRNLRFTYEIIMIIIGCLILGFGFSFFLSINHLSMGGFSGLSLVVNELLNKIGVKFLSTSVIYLILNAILFVFAFKTMGKNFSIKCAVGIVACSLAMQIFEWIPNNLDMELMISAIFGGIISGVGVGIAVMFGGSTGGSDMLGCIINHKFKRVSIGAVLRVVDIFVVLMQTFIFTNGWQLLPYTLIAVVVGSVALDYMNSGFKSPIAYHIVTSKPDKISCALMKYLKRGCTKLGTKGMYTNTESEMLLCIISGFQARDLRNIVLAIDKNAFIYSSKVSEVLGNFKEVDVISRDEKKEYMKEFNIEPKVKLLSTKNKIENKKQNTKINTLTNKNQTKPQTKSNTKEAKNKSEKFTKNGKTRQRISKT